MSKLSSAYWLAAFVAAGLAMSADAAPAKKKVKAKAAQPAAAATARATDISECGKLDASQRDACISRSRPVKGADLYKMWSAGGAAATAAPAAPAAPAKSAAAAVAPKAAAPSATGKALAKTTAIDDCAKLDASQRDACISRSAPVKGPDLYKKYK